MRKEYTINELAAILGCSRTAVVKKIKPDEDNPVIKRYKGRYEVRNTSGQITILLDDNDLEHEKKLSKGVNNVPNSTGYKANNSDVIDIEPEKENINNETVLNFTERYIDKFTTLQETMYNELRERDKQILLLTTSEKNKQEEYLKTAAENKTLKLRNTILTVLLGVAVTVLICFITYHVTTTTLSNNDTNQDIKKEHAQQEIPVQHARK